MSIFILSLDCEGKWGAADHLGAEHRETLSDARLETAYRGIIDLLERYEIAATFAFVGAFTWSRENARLDLIRALSRHAPGYFDGALADMATGQGWFGEWAVEMLPERHEVALHGATHLPWGAIDERTARLELELLAAMPKVAGAETYVFPRNQVNHVHLLRTIGIASWREARHRSRLGSLLTEFNPYPAPDAVGGAIPAGHFVNWRRGARRFVPPALSQFRARTMLARAAHRGEIVHYWTHPENIASAPATLDVLERILAEVAEFRSRGLVATMTQREYCQRYLPSISG